MPVLLLVLLIVTASFAYAGVKFAPWVPTYKKDIDRVFRLAGLKAGETFVDLGCGDGRMVIEAAKRGARAVGYEIALPMIVTCLVRRKPSGARFVFRDLFKADLSRADIVYLFGTPPTLRGTLVEKLERELKPGARVLSYAFALDGWTPAAVDRPDLKTLPINVYSR